MKIKHILDQWALNETFLHNRMAFICGPRQIGKTTMVQNFLTSIDQISNYHNWDSLSLKQKFASNPLFFIEDMSLPAVKGTSSSPKKQQWVVFDEIHKYPKWKNILKGYYDEWKENINFIITGSARLDYFRRSGDSLVGRYFLFKMNPLHPHDLTGSILDLDLAWNPGHSLVPFDEPNHAFQDACQHLFNLTGFPEPVSVGTKEFYRRWKNDHISLITNEDLRDLTGITNVQKIQTLVFLLPERVGAPLSLNNLKVILECAHASVKSWLEALKKVYLIFDIPPYTLRLKRSVLKEKKYYFWDWGILDDPGPRFENFVAVQLKRAVSAWNEWGKGDYQLKYVRTRDSREVDFVIVEKTKPLILIECKRGEKNLAPNLAYFKDRINAPIAIQVVDIPGFLKQIDRGVFIVSIDRFLKLMP